jgi:hypothetical protein
MSRARHNHRGGLIRIAIGAIADRGPELDFPVVVWRCRSGVAGPCRDDAPRNHGVKPIVADLVRGFVDSVPID